PALVVVESAGLRPRAERQHRRGVALPLEAVRRREQVNAAALVIAEVLPALGRGCLRIPERVAEAADVLRDDDVAAPVDDAPPEIRVLEMDAVERRVDGEVIVFHGVVDAN